MKLYRFVFLAVLAQILCFAAAAQSSLPSPRDEFRDRRAWAAVQTIAAAEQTYFSTSGQGGFGSAADLVAANLLGASFFESQGRGYVFTIAFSNATATSPAKFTVNAVPASYPRSGRLSFYTDERGYFSAADKRGGAVSVNDYLVQRCPSFGGAREDCVVEDIRAIYQAERLYLTTYGNYSSYSCAMWDLVSFGLLPPVFGGYRVNNYVYSASCTAGYPGSSPTMRYWSVPIVYGTTGVRSFYLDTNGRLHAADRAGAQATDADPVIVTFEQ